MKAQDPFISVKSPAPLTLSQEINKSLETDSQSKITNHFGKLYETCNRYEDAKEDDLFRCMKYFLIFGKLFGVTPISGIFGRDLQALQFRIYSLSGVLSMVAIFTLSCNTGIGIVGFLRAGGNDAFRLAKNASGAVCYCMGLYVYVFMFRNAQKIINLYHKWRCIESLGYLYVDTSLALSINLMAGIIFTSGISENAVSHVRSFLSPNATGRPILEHYYEDSHQQWNEMIPYPIPMAFLVFICNKLAVYAWNFGDIFIAVVSRALYGQFKGFLKSAEENLRHKSSGQGDWHQAIMHHTKLCKITEDFAKVLSPLVFISYGVNIYFLCLQVNLFVAPAIRLSHVDAIYLGWSFVHLITRIVVVSVCATKINYYAHLFSKLLGDCPREMYSLEIERAERKLASYPIGLDGLGTFFVGKPMMLSIIGVTCTFEVVLLQATAHLVPPPTAEETEDLDSIQMF